MKGYFFPPLPAQGYDNPYCTRFKEALANCVELLNAHEKPTHVSAWELLKYSTKAELYVFNWLEIVSYHRFGTLQFLLALLAFRIIIARRARIIWIFHNIEPHEGHSRETRCFYKLLFQHAHLIVAHSKEAEAFARSKAKGKVVYCCHPFMSYSLPSVTVTHFDIVIWGAILPYKGIPEFLSLPEVQSSGFRILVVGECKDRQLADNIQALTNDHIHFDNRRAPFEEIAALCRDAKYVLFPYIGDSVSSSGALIDTIVFGGTPVGPHRGAFKDLADEGACLTYRSYSELLDIIHIDEKSDSEGIRTFVKDHSWAAFAERITTLICQS